MPYSESGTVALALAQTRSPRRPRGMTADNIVLKVIAYLVILLLAFLAVFPFFVMIINIIMSNYIFKQLNTWVKNIILLLLKI